MDPQLTTGASGNYLFHVLYRGLFSYHSRDGLKLAGASRCERQKGRLLCQLKPDHRWSNGERIRASDYVTSFRRLIDPKLASPQSDLIFGLKNARAIWAGKRPPEKLGISAPSEFTLAFDFESGDGDPEFEFKLIHPALTPYPPSGYPLPAQASALVTSGPYRITQWKAGSWIRFEPNNYYVSKAKRPPIEAWFVDEDTTALRLYETGRLDFLRRLPARDIARFKGTPEFYQIPMARFDYVGFGPDLDGQKDLREALVNGVDFPTFLKMFDTLSPPGCPSLPARYMDKKVCRQPDFARAKAAAARAKPNKPRLEFQFSRMGGEDIARAAEWFQGQWHKNAGVDVELHAQEQGVFLRGLKLRPPPIFRKGVPLERPTCMAALEIFTKDHPENYIHLNDPIYDRLVLKAGQAKDENVRKRACREAVEHLMDSQRIIPLGELFYTILAKPRFKGWDLNELNQLDLSELEATSSL